MSKSDNFPANRIKNKVLIARIELMMEKRSLNAKTLAERIGPNKTLIHDIVSGKSGKPRMETIKDIAKALGTTVGYLLGDSDLDTVSTTGGGIRPIPVAGFAEAGAFRAMIDFDDLEKLEPETILAEPNKKFPGVRHFALKIRGDSMNAAKPYPIVEGMTALFIDLIDARLAIESGRIYAVRRTQDGGQTWECTIKRAQVFRDRYELSPESMNPIHQSVILPRPTVEDGRTDIEVIGLLYAVQFSYD